MNKYIALDCETGGLDPLKTDLLEVCAEILDENFGTVESIEISIRPDDEVYRVTADALAINNINLQSRGKTIRLSDARHLFGTWLQERAHHLIPIGHNVGFDLGFIKAQLLPDLWPYFHYRTLDTAVLGNTLMASGLVQDRLSSSLGSWVNYYGIEPPGPLHVAKNDVRATVAVLKRMLEDLKRGAPSAQ